MAPVQSAPMASVREDQQLETAAATGLPPQPAAEEVVREEIPAVEATPPAKPILEFDWQTDLTQIETDREKLKAAQARAHEQPAPPARKRERRPSPSTSDEPLVQVETRGPPPATERMGVTGTAESEPASTATTT